MNTAKMQAYIGVKKVYATPMKRYEYNAYRGWPMPDNENGADDGMFVEYTESQPGNDPRHIGYISWSPLSVFEQAYRPVDGMTFGQAIEALKKGRKVARTGWNGKGMWLGLVTPKDDIVTGGPIEFALFGLAGKVGPCLPWIGMRTADDKFVPWLASQTDMLAEDWQLID
jgi:hypothetical protein